MTHDAFTDRLSDYLDDELDAAERAAIDAHLAGCAACRDDARRAARGRRARGGARRTRRRQRDLWPVIAARIGARAASALSPFRRVLSARRFSFTLPQLAAAGLALMVLSGGARVDGAVGRSARGLRAGQRRTAAADVPPANFADPHYDEAVADLESTLEAGRDEARSRDRSACSRTTSPPSIAPSISAGARSPPIRPTCISTATWPRRGSASSRSCAVSARSPTAGS